MSLNILPPSCVNIEAWRDKKESSAWKESSGIFGMHNERKDTGYRGKNFWDSIIVPTIALTKMLNKCQRSRIHALEKELLERCLWCE